LAASNDTIGETKQNKTEVAIIST